VEQGCKSKLIGVHELMCAGSYQPRKGNLCTCDARGRFRNKEGKDSEELRDYGTPCETFIFTLRGGAKKIQAIGGGGNWKRQGNDPTSASLLLERFRKKSDKESIGKKGKLKLPKGRPARYGRKGPGRDWRHWGLLVTRKRLGTASSMGGMSIGITWFWWYKSLLWGGGGGGKTVSRKLPAKEFETPWEEIRGGGLCTMGGVGGGGRKDNGIGPGQSP